MSGDAEVAAAKISAKRKRQENADEGKKRRKSTDGDDDGDDYKAHIQTLENEILESKKHYNNIATLLEFAQKHDEDRKPALAATKALCRIFIRLLASGSLVKRKDVSEKDATVTSWLRDRLADYRGVLLSMFRSKKLALNALVLAMALLKAEAQHLSDREEAVFPRYFFSDVIAAILESPVEQLREEFAEKFINEYEDIRFYTFEAIKYGYDFAIWDWSHINIQQDLLDRAGTQCRRRDSGYCL
jgi:U3 small nucleolar RNA-associated protein 19